MYRKEKVILRRVPEYDHAAIQNVVREGLHEFGLLEKIQGRITIKPNVVMAHHKVTPSAYTRPEFLEGVLRCLDEAKDKDTKINIAEKCGAGLPTSRMFRRAGYYKLKKKHKFKLSPIDESKKRTVPLKKGTVHHQITTSREMVERDLLLYLPKLKTNALTQGLTGAVKLNVGILRDRERMWNHNHRLDEKIVDLLEVGCPDFIATDAIEISLGGAHLTQHGYPLGVVVMARNPVAHDAVLARMLHLDPEKIHHLKIAHQRGYGPLSLEDIEIAGDISLQEIRKKTGDWDLGVMRVEEVRCGMEALCGEPYCDGGCHGILLDWLHMIKDRKPKLWRRLPAWTVVVGKYKGDVTAGRLMILGTCSEVQGSIKARRKARIKGCPPKHKDLVLWFFLKAGILNPLFRLDLIWDAYPCLFFSWCRRLLKGAL
jgi:uncharacterized protein (DUF362 family)